MYQSLQAGRAVAAMLVVLFHLGGTFAQDKYFGFHASDRLFSWADAGVEYFFVLSGFLITIAHRADFGRPESLRGYIAKRLLRIFPTYWLVCLAVLAAAVFAPTLREALPRDVQTLLLGLALVPQDPGMVGGTGSPILFVAWSLQYELLFYAVIGLTVFNRSFGVCAGVALLAVWTSCHVGAQCTFPSSFVNNLILLFGMGVGGAYLVRSRIGIPFALPLGIAAIAAFVGYGAWEAWQGREALDVDRRLVYGVISTVIIVALARAEDEGTLNLRHRGIQVIGDSSYALYLLHIPVISLLVKFLVKAGVAGPTATTTAFVAVFFACLGAAVLFHITIERRLLSALRPLTAGRAPMTSLAAPLSRIEPR